MQQDARIAPGAGARYQQVGCQHRGSAKKSQDAQRQTDRTEMVPPREPQPRQRQQPHEIQVELARPGALPDGVEKHRHQVPAVMRDRARGITDDSQDQRSQEQTEDSHDRSPSSSATSRRRRVFA
jgi:hypothetical protein